MKTLLPAALTTSLLLTAAIARADVDTKPAEVIPVERARSAPVFTLYFENDYFGGEDRHYTNGTKLSWVSGDLSEWGQEGWRKGFLESLPFVNKPDRQKNFGFAIGQNIYTPKDTELAIPDPDDRPYAGWSYAELSFVSKNQHVMDTISIQLGIVGPSSLAEDTQRMIHKLINDDSPAGWDAQLRDEPGINLIYERKWRMAGRLFSDTLGIDFIPHIGASLGNIQTYGNAGGVVRAGFNLPSDFGVDLIRGGGAVSAPANDNDPRVSTRKNWSFFVFGGADGRAVARDIFLDGNTWKDSPSVDKKHFVADLYYGLGVILGTWQLTYTEALRTVEFDGQDGKSYFGSVTLSKAF
ncbi:MAG: lipid A deacylase LpxR family protein [Rariglobus sp.]